ncbi:STAS/SEC14 domain-containing protein [Corynebacterium halotolerans]|uniref:STAS/SEC14 domain-containing protein n=1 Tax=Corynebacterium halotolerans YIM 70093 = DSM 44683 TaxID=1121362 RepID=M1NQM0_9CORY|nr:STAS/SEC14 domain-containing protein [Corynebacterium halotolerans]AGF71812.1 hypothetical protein A605_04005 [Corynebacterium halotolerans YIM 70093 = DSM 44683]
MLTTDAIAGTNIVTAAYSGSIGTEEMEHLRSTVQQVIDREGSVRLLTEFGDIEPGRIEPKAWIEDLRMTGILGDIEKMAVVAGAAWLQKWTELAGGLIPGEVETFDAGQRDEARDWLRS